MIINFEKIKGLLENGNLKEVSRQTGIPYRSLQNWKLGGNSWLKNVEDRLYKLNDYIKKKEVIEMNLIEVTDVYGRKKTVNHAESKVYDYSNKKNEITYNGPIYENGKPIGFYTNYILPGKIDDIETKMNTWNNMVSGFYAQEVGFKSTENDPDNEIWDKYVEMVENNQEEYFDEHGDWKQDLVIDPRNLTRESFF